MVSAAIGTSACQPQISLLKKKLNGFNIFTFQTGKIQFIFSEMFILDYFLDFNSYIKSFHPICTLRHQQKPVQPLSA